jgi:hypothetical protein
MVLLRLCRERLERIQRILEQAGGEPVSLRQFTRQFNVCKWEVEQAAEMGWVEITIRKPATGRPSPLVSLREHSETLSAKRPPPRRFVGKMISCRHFNFALESINARKRGGGYIFHMQTFTDAYFKTFPASRKRHATTSSMSRLLKHPGVKAARAWFYAQLNLEIPFHERMPWTAAEIRQRLDKAGCRFAGRC